MARGNQRDLARAKNMKKDAKAKAGHQLDGYQLAKASLSNAEIMRQKQAKADEKRREEEERALREKKEAKTKK